MWAQVVACGQFLFGVGTEAHEVVCTQIGYVGHQFYRTEQNKMSSETQQNIPVLLHLGFSPKVLARQNLR